MTMPRHDSHQSQRNRILALLIRANGGFVSSLEICKISMQYSARLHELRALGHTIKSYVKKVGGKKHGFFRLVGEEEIEENERMARAREWLEPRPAPAVAATAATDRDGNLFENPERHRDDG